MRALLPCGVVAAIAAGHGVARAGGNDIDLARLATVSADGATVTRDNGGFRSLASAIGVVIAPDLLTPADTLGFGGFDVTFDAATTQTDPGGAYWRALHRTDAPSAMSTISVIARKGIWLPAPSFEVGAGATHVADSSMYAAQLYAKWALVEGYHEMPIPSFAVRGAVSRLMAQRDLDLTVVSMDAVVSKHFGIGGTWRLDPYAGYDLLAIIARSDVIDPTPTNDADVAIDFTFKDQNTILRHRLYAGAKAQLDWFQITAQAAWAFAGTSDDDRASVMAKDTTKTQRTLSVAAGFAF